MLKEHIFSQQQEMLHLLETLVNIDSGSYDKAGVDQVGSILTELYQTIGYKTDIHPNETLGNNYYLTPVEAHYKPQILIVAHLDTVFPKGTVSERPFSIEGDRAYGPGVIDMKASHVLTYFALKNLIATGAKESAYNVAILLNCDEEIGSHSSRSLIEAYAKEAQYALVMEPARANGAIVSSRRGVGTYKLSIKGKASHSGIAPTEGISAIEELAEKIQALHALNDHKAGLSINVGLISGGSSVNTIAPYASAEIDVRISTEAQGIAIDQTIRKLCSTPYLPGIELKLEGGINRPPMEKSAESAQIITLIKEEGNKLGLTIDDIATGGGSDASFTASMGIPTVDGLGPVGGGQHSAQEYLEIHTLPERTLLFANIVKRLTQLNNSAS